MDYQHGFKKGRSCETQLLITIEDIAKQLDDGMQTDMIILDFSKAFDTVPHQRLLVKLEYYGIRDNKGLVNILVNAERSESCSQWSTIKKCRSRTWRPSRNSFGTIALPDLY